MHDRESSVREVRVGLVSYLNVKPLVWAFEKGLIPCTTADGHRIQFEDAVPRLLAQRLREGVCHVGIVPTFEYFCHPNYSIIPAGAIATRRRVGSVIIVANAPLEKLQRVVLDSASLTSVHLLRILHAEHRWEFELVDGRPPQHLGAPHEWLRETSTPAGQLLIGDPALAALGQFPYTYDLGALWYELTGLPFVFATWLAHPHARGISLMKPLERAREIGKTHLAEIAAECAPPAGFAPSFIERYFRENLCFDLGEEEIAGLREFGRLCAKWGFCSPAATELRFQED